MPHFRTDKEGFNCRCCKRFVKFTELALWNLGHGYVICTGCVDNKTLESLSKHIRDKEEKAAFGWCRVCGRLLTDPTSVAAGIGPVCAGRPE